jgi:hypothetical protein
MAGNPCQALATIELRSPHADSGSAVSSHKDRLIHINDGHSNKCSQQFVRPIANDTTLPGFFPATVWAERFDKPVADLFDMQDEIIARLANSLNAQLITARWLPKSARHPANAG